MAKQIVVDTVREVLTAWAAGKSEPVHVFGPNEVGETPPEAPAFIEAQYPVANADRTTHSLSFVEEGAARLVILTERGAGIAQAIAWGEELSALFRAKRLNGIDFKTPTSPRTQDDNDKGNYFKTSIVVPYHYHYDDPET